jgi:predicted glycogen debranching enzyme
VSGDMHVVSSADHLPPLRLQITGGQSSHFIADEKITSEYVYPVEESRGYEFRGTLWTPGHFEVALKRGDCASLVASVESEEVMLALTPDDVAVCERERRRRLLSSALPQVQDETGAELVLAADQFIITPAGRVADATRASAMGNEIRTVIAGYHWFTDWGRDTMISLEGLTLITGRDREAGFILRTFAHYVRNGLIPNMFPDGSNEGRYNTADATLWFFHAVESYIRRTGDEVILTHLLPTMIDIVNEHVKGTKFGICVDPSDGLLHQGAEGYQLTWMDAKMGDWVVTPRRGKAVEINALFYNALRLLAGWLKEEETGIWGPARELGLHAADVDARAERLRQTFNRRFWNPAANCLFDVVDAQDGVHAGGDDPSIRPNQLLAISLPHPILERGRWEAVMSVVREQLVTPFGLRSLAPGLPDYKPCYDGDLRARDAAYHQGTVWGWLIGPFVDAWLKTFPDDRAGARRFLVGLEKELSEACVGTISEIFDADAPFTPRGCVAQAWSVAEAMRALVASAES